MSKQKTEKESQAKFQSVFSSSDKIPDGYVKLNGYIVEENGKKYQVFYNAKVDNKHTDEAYIRQEITS